MNGVGVREGEEETGIWVTSISTDEKESRCGLEVMFNANLGSLGKERGDSVRLGSCLKTPCVTMGMYVEKGNGLLETGQRS